MRNHVRALPATSLFALICFILIFIGVVITSPIYGTIISLATMLLIAVSYKITQ
ncbi:hypothetical protein [Aneurinibacillus terranovensis]|uniref:hypothetical protein n=1 Tax=Aneurinibacillus terranovensis TaxID=278991 RepID=UPI0004116A62|nr:hypothetical protein [Aneurinibacillus terranovensis]